MMITPKMIREKNRRLEVTMQDKAYAKYKGDEKIMLVLESTILNEILYEMESGYERSKRTSSGN